MKLEQSEHQIQSAILEYLACLDVYAWRNNVGMASGIYKGKKWFIKMGKAGLPDIIGVLGKQYKKHFGRMIAVEVKRPGKRTTDIQDRTINELLDYGALAFVAYSVQDVEKVLSELKGEK